MARPDPYKVLGVPRRASDAELRAAYRRLVQLHHPDHNGGSAESARRFEEVQEAYAEVRRARAATAAEHASRAARAADATGSRTTSDADLDARIVELERQLREAREASDRARRAAAAAAAAATASAGSDGKRPSDEELGYIRTDDSFSKIFDDALSQVSERLSGSRPASERAADALEELAARLRRGR